MNLINRYPYAPLEKITYPSGFRHYICPQSGEKLASVTTILDSTAGDKKELREWKLRVGEKEANRIKNEALGLGTLMHLHLEKYILGESRPGGNNLVRIQAEKMADQIIEHGLVNVSEVWGSEIPLYVPEAYAGTCDGIAVWHGKPAVIDFKTAKKIRTRKMIEDYFLQISAYGIAFNELYGTKIKTGVIFMVDRDFNYKEFIIEDREFHSYEDKFFDRLEQFMNIPNVSEV
jgi:genome maintenance exonuclease 1